MNPRLDHPDLSIASCQFSVNSSPSSRASGPAVLIALALAALITFGLAPSRAAAQQPYPQQPHGAYPSPDQTSPYPPQYAQPAPQPGDGQPQYQQAPPYGYGQPQSSPPQNYADQQPYAPGYDQQAPTQWLSAQDLEQLLAPIALYPDALLAQILAASTYPAEVAIADQWVQQMRASGYGSPDQIAAGANAQTNWDPSVKALTAFPDVLDMMNHNLEWTTNLGNAYYNQPQDVMQTVQVLRERAEQAGNLQSTPQEQVETDQGNIELAPTSPEEVYVPTYDPWDVYGAPVAPYPGFSLFGALGNFFGGAPIQYGLGFALAAFDRMPFGWLAWGLDWLGHALLFDHSAYYTRSASVRDWGLPRGGPRVYYGSARGASGWGAGPNRAGGDRTGYVPGSYGQRRGWPNERGAQSYVRPEDRFPEPGRFDYSNRGTQPGSAYTHPALPAQSYQRPAQAYTRVDPTQSYGNRPQTYSSPVYGYANRPQTFSNSYGYANRSTNGYAGQQAYSTRPGFTYANPYGSYRAPVTSNSHAFSDHSYETSRTDHSGGFHLFGGGDKAPKYSYKAPKSYGGFGGHEKAPKMSHSSGGGGYHHR